MSSRRQALRAGPGAAPAASERSPRGPGLFRTIWQDMAAFAELKGSRFPSLGGVVDVLLMPGVMATITFRFAHAFHRAGLRPLSRLLYIWNMVLFSVDIAPGVTIGPGFVMPHPVGVGMGKDVRLGAHVRVMGLVRLGGGATEDPELDGMPVIGDDCWLLDGCKVFGPITVGEGVVIATGAVVMKSIPDRVVVAGAPARVVRHRSGQEST